VRERRDGPEATVATVERSFHTERRRLRRSQQLGQGYRAEVADIGAEVMAIRASSKAEAGAHEVAVLAKLKPLQQELTFA